MHVGVHALDSAMRHQPKQLQKVQSVSYCLGRSEDGVTTIQLMQTKQPLCGISQTKVNISRYRTVQQR